MKTDTLFYRLFQRRPQLALELLGLHYRGDSYRFSAEEIKQTAFRLDGIFTPIAGDPEQPLIFAEVQYQPDPDFYARFFSEITLYLRLNKPGRRWLALVIYPARSVEKPAGIEFEPFMSLPQLHRIYLKDYQDRKGLSPTMEFIRLIGSGESQTMDLARQLMERRDKISQDDIDFIETILVYKLPNLNRQEIIAMLNLDNITLKQTRFYQEIAEEENEKGRQEESLRLVSRMLRHKFGIHAALQQAEQELPKLSVEQLEDLAEALLDFTESQELTRWLASKLA
jgi:predicted transposase/invertase (TIGR01784 family)